MKKIVNSSDVREINRLNNIIKNLQRRNAFLEEQFKKISEKEIELLKQEIELRKYENYILTEKLNKNLRS
jgi:DNA-directed RNA polymerase